MGGLQTNITAVMDKHDDQAVPNSTLPKLYNLANVVTRDKQDMKIEYWKMIPCRAVLFRTFPKQLDAIQ